MHRPARWLALIFIIVIAAAETTVGMAIVLLVYRGFRGIQADRINFLKW